MIINLYDENQVKCPIAAFFQKGSSLSWPAYQISVKPFSPLFSKFEVGQSAAEHHLELKFNFNKMHWAFEIPTVIVSLDGKVIPTYVAEVCQ